MNLESNKLIREIENYFGVSITQQEARQLDSIQQIADVISQLIGCETAKLPSIDTNYIVFSTLRRELQAVLQLPMRPARDELLGPLLRAADQALAYPFLEYVAQLKGWRMPNLYTASFDEINRSPELPPRLFTRPLDWAQHSLADLTGWIISLNHVDFFDPSAFDNADDVLRTVIGIISKETGVPVWHIRPQDSLTNSMDTG